MKGVRYHGQSNSHFKRVMDYSKRNLKQVVPECDTCGIIDERLVQKSIKYFTKSIENISIKFNEEDKNEIYYEIPIVTYYTGSNPCGNC